MNYLRNFHARVTDDTECSFILIIPQKNRYSYINKLESGWIGSDYA